MNHGDSDQVTRKQWFKCALIAAAIFSLNHWYWMDSGAFFPIAVWGAPLFCLVGISGIVFPNQIETPWLVIGAAITGLALGILAHIRIYGF